MINQKTLSKVAVVFSCIHVCALNASILQATFSQYCGKRRKQDAMYNIWITTPTSFNLSCSEKRAFDSLLLSQDHQMHILTCGLLSGPKFMLGVDCSDTEGDPRDDVMTG